MRIKRGTYSSPVNLLRTKNCVGTPGSNVIISITGLVMSPISK